MHSTWRHWIDSSSLTPEDITDEGDMLPQADGERTLERGSMINPETGKLTEYEECWRDVGAVAVGHGHDGDRGAETLRVCAVLELQDDANQARGMVVRVGQYCQGVVRVGEHFTLERWGWKGAERAEGSAVQRQEDGEQVGEWKRLARIGDWWLPCGAAIEERLLKLRGEVKHHDMVWKVIELSHF